MMRFQEIGIVPKYNVVCVYFLNYYYFFYVPCVNENKQNNKFLSNLLNAMCLIINKHLFIGEKSKNNEENYI